MHVLFSCHSFSFLFLNLCVECCSVFFIMSSVRGTWLLFWRRKERQCVLIVNKNVAVVVVLTEEGEAVCFDCEQVLLTYSATDITMCDGGQTDDDSQQHDAVSHLNHSVELPNVELDGELLSQYLDNGSGYCVGWRTSQPVPWQRQWVLCWMENFSASTLTMAVGIVLDGELLSQCLDNGSGYCVGWRTSQPVPWQRQWVLCWMENFSASTLTTAVGIVLDGELLSQYLGNGSGYCVGWRTSQPVPWQRQWVLCWMENFSASTLTTAVGIVLDGELLSQYLDNGSGYCVGWRTSQPVPWQRQWVLCWMENFSASTLTTAVGIVLDGELLSQYFDNGSGYCVGWRTSQPVPWQR